MARTKQRSKKPFLGRRKIHRRRKEKTDLLATAVADDVVKLVEPRPRSASERKLACFGVTLESTQIKKEREADDQFMFVQKSSLASLLSKLLCPNCNSPGISLRTAEDKMSGFAAMGSLFCTLCEEVIQENYLCQRVGNSRSTNVPFEINTRATLAFRGIGCGFSSMKEWCGMMNLPCSMSQSVYKVHNKKIHDASISNFSEVQQQSVKAIFEAYRDLGETTEKNGILDIAVSFDGAWQRRGHSSHNGVAAVIDLLTGLPVDYEVLSNFCLKCKIAASSPGSTEVLDNKHTENCPKDFEGSANSMEVECALRIWRRLEQKHNLRYTVMLSDGDSKAYDSVVSDKPYGQDIAIEKEDCVNHISKRMGTALRNLVATSKAQRQSIAGKGKLTQERITKVQNYYGRAIKDNANDVELMKKRIFAILFHLSSSNEHPKHIHCPPGAKSWCFWQRAVAQGEVPGSHKEHETLPADIGKKLVPIFQRLSEENLLKRCARNKTQNPNESLHNVIWKYCPKATFVGRKTMETAVSLAVCQFSVGSTCRTMLCKLLGIVPGFYLEKASNEKDHKRLKKSLKASTDVAKKRRKQLKYNKVSLEQKKKGTEGIMYSAGSFDVPK